MDLFVVNAILEANVRRCAANDLHLTSGLELVVIARDPKQKRVLVAGYGAHGAGLMWLPDAGPVQLIEGYDQALEVIS